MPNPNSVIVNVIITANPAGGPCTIQPVPDFAPVARGATGSPPPNTPVIWQVDPSSTTGAKITGMTILADASGKTPPPGGGSYSSWSSSRPQPQPQGTSGNWSVMDLNDNNDHVNKKSVYFGYDITCQIGNDASTSNTLDPGIDNQPPSP